MPLSSEVVKYLFHQEYNGGTILVDFTHKWRLNRNALSTLLPRQWIAGEVIDCVAFYLWRENFYDEKKRNIWNLPALFSNLASSDTMTDTDINSMVFGEHDHFRSLPRDCQKINIPIINAEENHWYLCIIDMKAKKILIFDTCPDRKAERRGKAKKVVARLDRITKLWGRGQYFSQDDWAKTFIWEDFFVPPQVDSYSCGLYVILQMMFPDATLRLLTEEESVVTCYGLATLLYGCILNQAERGMEIIYVIHSNSSEICFDSIDSLGKNLQQTIAYITTGLEMFLPYDQEPELHGRLPKGTEFIPIRSDDELRRFLRNYTDKGLKMVDVKVVVVEI